MDSPLETVIFQGQVVNVKTMLSFEDIIKLVSVYVSDYFSRRDDNNGVLTAEYGFKSVLAELATDITITEDDFAVVAGTSFFDDIESKISNLEDVRTLIDKTIWQLEKQNSFESKLALLVENLSVFVQSLSESGIDGKLLESIKNLVSEVKTIETIKEEPVVKKNTSKSKGKKDVSS